MASFNSPENRTYIASIDLDNFKHRFVAQTATARKITLASANQGVGVLLNKPKAGEHATVAIRGQVKVHAGAAVGVGNQIFAANSGFAQVHSPGTQVASGSTLTERWIMGRAITAAASGSVFTLELDQRFTQVVSA